MGGLRTWIVGGQSEVDEDLDVKVKSEMDEVQEGGRFFISHIQSMCQPAT